MDEDTKPRRTKEKPPKPEKAAKPAKTPRPDRHPKPEKEPKRRERVLDAADTFVPDKGDETMNDAFRKRLAYLMNGNNSLGKAVNIQELADAVGVSRPAIRKYLNIADRLRDSALFRHYPGFPARI